MHDLKQEGGAECLGKQSKERKEVIKIFCIYFNRTPTGSVVILFQYPG